DGIAPGALFRTFLGILHAADVIGIGDADIADAGKDVAGDVTVTTGGLARQVGLDPAQPRLGLFRTVMGDQRREQAGVVRMLAGTDAYPPLPLRIRQVLVGEAVQLQVLVGI